MHPILRHLLVRADERRAAKPPRRRLSCSPYATGAGKKVPKPLAGARHVRWWGELEAWSCPRHECALHDSVGEVCIRSESSARWGETGEQVHAPDDAREVAVGVDDIREDERAESVQLGRDDSDHDIRRSRCWRLLTSWSSHACV